MYFLVYLTNATHGTAQNHFSHVHLYFMEHIS